MNYSNGQNESDLDKNELHNTIPLSSKLGISNLSIVAIKPQSFDDVNIIADHIKSCRGVFLNLDDNSAQLARRIIDFVSGVAYAMNASMENVSGKMFIIVPESVSINEIEY